MVKLAKISLVLVVTLLSACVKNNPKITKTVPLEAFDQIELNSSFDVELVEDSAFYVEVIGHQKTVEKMSLVVENDVLKIDNLLKNKFVKPKTKNIVLVIHSKPLKMVISNETCDVSTRTPITSVEFGIIMRSKGNYADLELKTQSFYYWNNYPCGGKMTLRGTTDQLKIWNTAIFSVDAKSLYTKYCFVENSSKGKCEVQVSETIEYTIKGEGNIEAYGAPSMIVEKEKTGSGAFILF